MHSRRKNWKNALRMVLLIIILTNGAIWVQHHAYAATVTPKAITVYGQGGSFITNTVNNGGVSANSLNTPRNSVLDSSGNLYVTDYANNRVLYYPSGSTTATRVYGQAGSFTSNTANNGGISANSLNYPTAIALDSSNNLYITDTSNNRILYYPSGSTTATRVYGQNGSFTSNNGGVTATSLNNPNGIALDGSGNLYVTDYYNNRVLYYPSGSTTTTRVYGQAGSFTTATANNGGISANSLYQPVGVASDSSGNIYVADTGNSRVLYYPSGSTTATRVYGQVGSFTTATANNGGISATSLNTPTDLILDGSGNIYVADNGNSRVLYYSSGSTTATRVYGQGGSFTSNTYNNGGISATSLAQPFGITISSGNIYVADTSNNRMLTFQTGLSVTTQPPSSTIAGTSFGAVANLIDVGSGAVFSDFSGTVSAAIKPGTGPTGATLGGTTSSVASSGVMTFSGLSINTSGTGYVLILSYPGVNAATTSSFTITALVLAGYWPFDEGGGTTTADKSGNNNTGTITGATWTTGQVNGALSFNGTSDYASMGAPTALKFGTSSFSAMAWFKTSVTTSGMMRIINQGVGSWNSGFNISLGAFCTGCVSISLGGTSPATTLAATTATTFNDGNWHLASLVINRTANTAQLYVDGVAQTLTTATGTCGTASGTSVSISSCTSLSATTTDPFVVGVYTGASGTFQYFNGNIDEVRLYNSALSSSQIQSQYASDTATSTPHGYWPFDEGSGTTTADLSGNNNTGTITGATWTTGQVNGALSFNGSSYVSMGTPTVLQFGTGSFTLMSWFKTTGTTSERVVSTGAVSQSNGYYMGVNRTICSGCVSGGIGNGSTASLIYGSSTANAFNNGIWHQEAMVINRAANTAQMYVDGVAQTLSLTSGSCGSVSGTTVDIAACSNLNASGGNPFTVGSSGSATEYFNGSIDEVRVYGNALSSSQIQSQYATDTTSPPTAHWPFDENGGTTAYDSSSNHINGTLTGTPTWTAGAVNSGLSFNGTNNYVAMGTPAALQLGTGSLTLISWFKTSATSGFQRMMSMGNYGWTNGYLLSVGPNPSACAGCVGGSVGGGSQASSLMFYTTTSFNDGKWHQAAMIIDRGAGTAQIYVDGVAQAVSTEASTCGTASGTTVNIATCTSLNASGTTPFTIGSYSGTNEFFNGSLDEPRIYASSVSSQEVLNLYNNDVNALSEYATNATFAGTIGSTVSYTLPISVGYQLTPAPGWSLSITSTTLTSGTNTLPTTASSLTSVTNTCTSTCSPTTMTNTIGSFPTGLPAGSTSPTAVKFFGAASGNGTGDYTVTPTISVNIPATAKAGTYTSTITLTTAVGP